MRRDVDKLGADFIASATPNTKSSRHAKKSPRVMRMSPQQAAQLLLDASVATSLTTSSATTPPPRLSDDSQSPRLQEHAVKLARTRQGLAAPLALRADHAASVAPAHVGDTNAAAGRSSLIPKPRHCATSPRRWALAYPEPQQPTQHIAIIAETKPTLSEKPSVSAADLRGTSGSPTDSGGTFSSDGPTPVSSWASALDAAGSPSPSTATTAVCPAPSAPSIHPAPRDFTVTKIGVPWRGSYMRTLRVGAGLIRTLDPSTGHVTNTWVAPRDVPFCTCHSARDLVLFVAPWPAAPNWALQKLALSCGDALVATLDALREAGVRVEGHGHS